jgi:phosphoglycolate phosphatase
MALIFDFDGVICDSYGSVLSALQSFDKESKILNNAYDAHKLRALDFLKVFQAFNIEHSQIGAAVAHIQNFLADNMDSLNVIAGVKEVLHELQHLNIKMGIITSNSSENVINFLKKHEINVFDFIVPAGLSNKGEIIKEVMLKKQYEPKKVLYIGDETRDILASQSAGVKSIAVGWGFNNGELLLKYNPDYYIEIPNELVAIVQDLKAIELECKLS